MIAKELLVVVPNQGLNVPPTYCFMGTGNLCNSVEGYEMKTCTRLRDEDLHALCSVGGPGWQGSMTEKLASDWVAPDFGAVPVP